MAIENNCPNRTLIDYKDTNYFSKIAVDYVEGAAALKPFYSHPANKAGIEAAMKARSNFSKDTRQVLQDNMRKHYENTPSPLTHFDLVRDNIASLTSENTFTITTAHQPNIFGGPLYLVYKILHVIQIAEALNEQYADKHFVPVYYMGSEDADLEEIGQMQVDGKRYVWQTDQTGPVGRMLVDKKLISLIDELEGQIGVGVHGPAFIDLLRESYKEGCLIQEATFTFIHQLFGKYGLLILMPDDQALKEVFEPIVIKELKEGFSHQAVEQSSAAIAAAGYKVQTHGRPINLFYQEGNSRKRIITEGEDFKIEGEEKLKSAAEIIQEVKQRADLFSGNVVLRGPFQETVLPNIAFVGGGGELAYWLEMKGVYEAAQVPYPVLLLRNSFMLMRPKEWTVLQKLGLSAVDLFKPLHEIQDLLLAKSGDQVDMVFELEALKQLYENMREKAAAVDPTLSGHTDAISKQALNKAARLVTKMKSANRKKIEIQTGQLQFLKDRLFPGASLQERTENIAGFYADYGDKIFDLIKKDSEALTQQFGVLYLPEADKHPKAGY